MSFSHVGGWISGPCDAESVWQGAVNQECFIVVWSSDFAVTGGTVAFTLGPGTGGALLPQPTTTDAASSPWYIKPNSTGPATYTLTFPRGSLSKSMTVRAYPLNAVGSTDVRDSGGGFGNPGPVTLLNNVSIPTSGAMDLIMVVGRATGGGNSGSTVGSNLTGCTLLMRKRYAIASGAQSVCFELWWRPRALTSITGTTTIQNWQFEWIGISNVASPYVGSDVGVSPAAHSTGPQTETVSVTSTTAGHWLLVTVNPIRSPQSMVKEFNIVAAAGVNSLTRTLLADQFMTGFVLPQVTTGLIDQSGTLAACVMEAGFRGWKDGRRVSTMQANHRGWL